MDCLIKSCPHFGCTALGECGAKKVLSDALVGTYDVHIRDNRVVEILLERRMITLNRVPGDKTNEFGKQVRRVVVTDFGRAQVKP